MLDFMTRVQEKVDEYAEFLSECGIKISASRRYFETEARERTGNVSSNSILNVVDRAMDKKKEKRYKNVRNRYYCIILSVSPSDKNIVPRDLCREYAFLHKKVDRPHLGVEPRNISCAEDKLLSKIEKRILKILRKTKKAGIKKACKDTYFDAFRYTCAKYGYKRRFLGRERAIWELIFMLYVGLFAIFVCFGVWLLSFM